MQHNKQIIRKMVSTRRQHYWNLRVVGIAVMFLVAIGLFVLGFTLRGNVDLLQHLGFPASVTGVSASKAANSQLQSDKRSLVASRLSEVETVLANESLDSYDIDDATTKLLDGFASAAKDPNLRYYTAERYRALLNSETQAFSGIGVLFAEKNGKAYAVDVFENSPAQLNDVRVGDVVVALDGDRSQKWSRAEVIAALNRDEGTSIVITWLRPDAQGKNEGHEFTTTLVCKKQQSPNVRTELHNDTGYIALTQLTATSSSLVRSAISELKEQGATAFVLDLRNNPGGYLSQALDIIGAFSKDAAALQIKTRFSTNAKSATGAALSDAPLTIIVNKNTASAAEVIASSLQESKRCIIVGQTSMGKGSVQITRELSFGGALRYTVAVYLTPKGREIDGRGVSPDVAVDNNGSEDFQKNYALETAHYRTQSK